MKSEALGRKSRRSETGVETDDVFVFPMITVDAS